MTKELIFPLEGLIAVGAGVRFWRGDTEVVEIVVVFPPSHCLESARWGGFVGGKGTIWTDNVARVLNGRVGAVLATFSCGGGCATTRFSWRFGGKIWVVAVNIIVR